MADDKDSIERLERMLRDAVKPEKPTGINQPWVGHLLTALGVVAMMVTAWVSINGRITALEADNRAKQRTIERLERESDRAVDQLKADVLRETRLLRDDLKELKALIKPK